MFSKKIACILFFLSVTSVFNLSCYTIVEKVKYVDYATANPYANREFIGEWLHDDYTTPLLSLRKTSKLNLLPNRNYYFYPNFYLQPYIYFVGDYYVKADTMIFNIKDRRNLVKYLYYINQDTLLLKPINSEEIQFWYKPKHKPRPTEK